MGSNQARQGIASFLAMTTMIQSKNEKAIAQ